VDEQLAAELIHMDLACTSDRSAGQMVALTGAAGAIPIAALSRFDGEATAIRRVG
jgi:hypothetical protein